MDKILQNLKHSFFIGCQDGQKPEHSIWPVLNHTGFGTDTALLNSGELSYWFQGKHENVDWIWTNLGDWLGSKK